MMELSHAGYYLIGALVVSNLGAIGSLLAVAFKVTWWISKLESKVEGTKEMSIRAHKRLDKIEDHLR